MAQQVCDPNQIRRFLAEQLSANELEAFVSHLDECEVCGQTLSELSASRNTWKDARLFLAADPPGSSDELLVTQDQAYAPSEAETPSVGFLAPSDDPRMLGRFGPYEILGVIGWGGMGVVLKGLDGALNRYVAIKVLAPQLATDGTARRRFAREAQAAAAVVHDNVIPVYGVDEFNELPYLVMPYVGGSSLQKRIDKEGPLPLSETLRIAAQTAAGLAAAHAQGLVHRDIKPANLLLLNNVERVRITDFGLARAADDRTLTRIGVIAGTPEFMSPEQARGEAIDYRSDLFSLGSVMYAMCTGRPPFRANSSFGVLQKISQAQPTSVRELSPELPDWMSRLIGKLHAKLPEDRFGSAEEVSLILHQCLAHTQNASEPLPDCLREELHTGTYSRRNPVTWIALGTLMTVVCVTAFFLIMQHGKNVATTTKNAGSVEGPSSRSVGGQTALFDQQPPSAYSNSTSLHRVVAYDDFDSAFTLDWKPVRPVPSHASLTKNPGALTITTQFGTIHLQASEDPGGQPARNIFLIDNPVGTSDDFVVTTMLDGFTPSEGQQQAGLILYDDDDNYVKWAYEADLYTNKQKFVLVRETDGEGQYSDLGGPQGLNQFWLRVRRQGNQYEFAASTDGKTYQFAGMKDWNGSPTKLGLIAKNGAHPDTTTTELDAPFAFFEVRSTDRKQEAN